MADSTDSIRQAAIDAMKTGEDVTRRVRDTTLARIIHLVEQSHLAVRRTLAHLGIPRATFDRWCERYHAGGLEALTDKFGKRFTPDAGWESFK